MNHRIQNPLLVLFAGSVVLAAASVRSADESKESFRYLRPSGAKFVKESEIEIDRSEKGYIIKSQTQRPQQSLSIVARYDEEHALRAVEVVERRGQSEETAEVRINLGRALVSRGNQITTLRCPAGVIVTSAPDWTDSFLAVRKYDRTGPATQKFSAIWIHPTREPLELEISLSLLGSDEVQLDEVSHTLSRYLLVLRGGSRYVVWANDKRQLVRLVGEKSGRGGIILAGWEAAVKQLQLPRKSR